MDYKDNSKDFEKKAIVHFERSPANRRKAESASTKKEKPA